MLNVNKNTFVCNKPHGVFHDKTQNIWVNCMRWRLSWKGGGRAEESQDDITSSSWQEKVSNNRKYFTWQCLCVSLCVSSCSLAIQTGKNTFCTVNLEHQQYYIVVFAACKEFKTGNEFFGVHWMDQTTTKLFLFQQEMTGTRLSRWERETLRNNTPNWLFTSETTSAV